MSNIVVYREALKSLTRKRVFEVKLKGAALCMMYDDMLENWPLLLEAEIFKHVQDDNDFVVERKVYIVFPPHHTSFDETPKLLKLVSGNRFTIGDLGGEKQLWKIL